MIHSIFESLKSCINSPYEEIFTKLDEINVHLFEPLWNEEDDRDENSVFTREESGAIIMYLIFAYSQHSEWLILGADGGSEKISIAERVNLPEYLYGKVVKLQSNVVRKVMVKYLDAQSSRAFKYLSFKKDMYEAAMANGILSLQDEDGKVDLKQMAQADTYMRSLLNDMKEYEEELRAEYNFVYQNKEAVEDIEKAMKRKTDTGNVEHSSYIS